MPSPYPAKPWIKLDGSEADGQDAEAKAMVFGIFKEGFEVGESLTMARDAARITESAHEVVDGVGTTRYVVTFDLAKLAEANPAMKQVYEGATGEMRQEIWVDGNNLPIRVRSHDPSTTDPADAEEPATLTFRGWGERVDIKAPPSDQIGRTVGG